jgi:ATP-binding cassette, subfamily B, bacterial
VQRISIGELERRTGYSRRYLASGLDTQLGPTWPSGVELSFGQWQKLALARGFMRDEPLLLILDEPTDLIVVLDGARLVEVGTHDELMTRRGRYPELYSIQAAAYR